MKGARINISFPMMISLLKRGMLIVACFICTQSVLAQTGPAPEYQVKAVFLYNFSRFVDWPELAFESTYAPFVIGIIGNDPFGNYIEEAVAEERIGTHRIKVARYKDISEITNCQILYIGISDREVINKIMDAIIGESILTVSDVANFAKWGGMIRFYTENDRIRLEINNSNARAAGLKISSKLLRVANVF